jgi:hypothetical protein
MSLHSEEGKKMVKNMLFSLVSKIKLRAKILWIPGILIIAIGIFIPIRKAWLLRYNEYVAKHAVACKLNVDLSKEGTVETSFSPMVTREFYFSLNPAQDMFSSNPIEKAMKSETFKLSWKLSNKNQTIAAGIISEKDLSHRVQTLDIRYVFAKQNVLLRKDQDYKLVVEVMKPSPGLAVFSSKLLIRTWASLKGYILIGWKMWDTLQCLVLGTVLIIAGLIKRSAF